VARQLVPVWHELLALRAEGAARAVGVSNYSVGQIETLIRATGQAPAVNQIPWGPTLYDAGLLAACRDLGVVVEGYSPLKNTNLGRSRAGRDRRPAWRDPSPGGAPLAHRARRRGHPEVGPPGPDRSNIDLFGFTLTADEIAAIDGLRAR